MRTKKILSILLAMIMAIGMFGIVGAFAEEEDGELQALLPVNGFSAGVALELEVRNGKNWGEKIVAWVGFTNTADSTKTYAKLQPTYAKIDWTVTAYEKKADGSEDLTKPVVVTVYDLANQASGKPFKVYKLWNGTEELLYLEQGSSAYYGTLVVTAKVTVTGAGGDVTAGVSAVATETITLTNQTAFNKLIADAKELAGKTDRYTKDYIDLLKLTIADTEIYNAFNPGAATIDRVMTILQERMDEAKDNYKLTGIDFLDNLLGNNFMKIIWSIMDFFTSITAFFSKLGDTFGPILKFFGDIGTALGYLMPLFSLLGLVIPGL